MYNDHLGAASIPHAPHQEWRHAGAESWADERDPGATRAKRCATIIPVKRLQKEVEELQERNLQLRSLHAQVALGPMGVLEEDGGDGGDRIHLLTTFIRHRSEFRDALAEAMPLLLLEVRLALEQAGFNWQRGCGTKAFVHPHQFEDIVALMKKKDLSLHKQHVMVAESLAWNVTHSVFHLRSRTELGSSIGRPSAASSAKESSNMTPGLEVASDMDQWTRRELKRREEGIAAIIKRWSGHTHAMERLSQCDGGN